MFFAIKKYFLQNFKGLQNTLMAVKDQKFKISFYDP